MIMRDPGYACSIPMLRIDVLYNEENNNFYFVELNTDGTTGMNEDRVLNEALALTEIMVCTRQREKKLTLFIVVA